jgi:hypothetical protein
MRKQLAVFISLSVLVACKKSDSFKMPSASNKLVSATGYTGTTAYWKDTFTYNTNGDILSQKEYVYNGNITDSFVLSFSYAGNSNTPVSYTILDGWGTFTYALSYDNQSRLVKDTTIPDLASRAATFSYPNNNIAYTSADNASADTFFIANNNLTKTSQAEIPFNPANYDIATFTYTGSYPNPYYYTGQTKNLRLLLTKIDAWENLVHDFISQQAFTGIRESNGYNIILAYTTDPGSGLVTKATQGSDSVVFRYQ